MNNGFPEVPCPNPYCDPTEGCCICEHTGRIDVRAHAFLKQISDGMLAEQKTDDQPPGLSL